MPIAKAFKNLPKTLTRSMIGVHVVITMDGVPVPTKAIFTRRSEPLDADRQVFATAAPALAFWPSTLPRRPMAEDVIVDDEGKVWKIKDGTPEDYGAGMLEYELRKG